MALVTVNFDDSGTHTQASTAVAACYASTAEQWKEFERNWKDAEQDEHFGVFHMADFAACQKQFKGWSDAKRERVLDRLCRIIRVRARVGVSYGVNKRDYDEVIQGKFRNYSGQFHYTYAVRSALAFIRAWRHAYESQSTMQYVFDQMSHGKGELISVMDWAIEQSKKEAKTSGIMVVGGYSFESKETVVPLQAADILAWTTFQHMQAKVSKRPLSEIARVATHYLNRLPTLTSFHMEREKLEEWAKAEEAAIAKRPAGWAAALGYE
jgi:hypothetical protein